MRTYSVDNPLFPSPYVVDSSSCFRPGDPVMERLELDLEVNLKSCKVNGRAHLTFDKPGEVALDFTGEVLSVVTVGFGDSRAHPLKFIRDDAGAITGLIVKVPADEKVTINYLTHSNAAGLHWMDARQTGSRQPMVMSQNQPIGARSWIPCQDTPQVKFTWEASVRVSADLHASVLMSDGKNHCTRHTSYCSQELDAFMFEQHRPVPAYLIWLVVGQFEKREVHGVALFAERAVIDQYVAELEACQIGRLVSAAREMFGELVWGPEFAVFVPPASFPYGGMENTGCVAISSTSMDGRGSSGYVVLHELAHTWFGNMVTCATWTDLWLNEGFATWAELLLVEAVYGRDAAEVLYYVNQRALRQALENAEKSPVQKKLMQIAPDLIGVNPEDAPTTLAYHGGAYVLLDIEARVGRQAFMRFALDYLERFRFQAVTTQLFAQFAEQQFGANVTTATPVGLELERRVSVQLRLDHRGFSSSVSDAVRAVTDARDASCLPREAWPQWSAMQQLLYLHGLRDLMPQHAMSVLELSHGGNDEVFGMQLEVWLRACAAQQASIVRYHTQVQEMKRYLGRVGRMKCAKPIFHALMVTPDGAAIAQSIFSDVAPFMSSQWKRAVRAIVYPNGPTKPAFPPATEGTPTAGA